MKNKFNRYDIEFSLIGLGLDNVNQIYKKNYNTFLFYNSDNVQIDGKKLSTFEKAIYFYNCDIDEIITTCDTKDGFPLTELDFVEYQLKIFTIDLEGKDFKQNELIKIYRDFLNKKKKELLKHNYNKKRK